MKKKLTIGLIIFTTIFIFSGIYVITNIRNATSELDNLITLHQVEILREHLLLQIKKVQSDINLKNTRYAKEIDTVVDNMRQLERVAATCFDCHHSEEMTAKLVDLQNNVTEYRDALGGLLTISASPARIEAEEDNVYKIGERLNVKVNNMISIASSKLESKTQESLRSISETRTILNILILSGPFAAAVFVLFFVRGITKPVAELQRAARKIKEGHLDYKIHGLKDEFGEVAASFNDMSDALSHSMKEIRESETRYRLLFESAGDAIFILESEAETRGKIISANQSAANMHGYTVDELLKLNITDLDAPDAARKAPDRIKRMMNGEWIHEEIQHLKKDGTVFPVEISAGLLESMGHKYILAFDRDITERKDAEANLRDSEKKFKAIFDNAIDGILLAEVITQEFYTGNSRICQMLGYSLEELKKLKVSDIHPEAELARIVLAFEAQARGDSLLAREIPVKRKDGSVFYADISVSTVTIKDKTYLMGIFRDISERKKAEEMLLQSKMDWEDTFNTITDMITIHDKNSNIIRANKAAREILGLKDLDTSMGKCYEFYHGKDYPPANCPCHKTLATGEPVFCEMFEPHLNRFLEIRSLPRFDRNNHVIGMIHIIRDITERKRVEEALQRAEQMKMVGEWAAGLAHEIKNPLAGIKISVEVLADELTHSEEGKEIVTRVIDQIKRIEFLLKNLLDYAKPPKPHLVSSNLNDLLDKTISFALQHPSLPSGSTKIINIVKELDAGVPKIMVDPYQMQQAFLNLLLNAIDAMEKGGTLSVKTFLNAETDSVMITVSDTGRGMDRDTASKIFQPFFTTKSKGTGLGLAITKRIVEQIRGSISIESEVDRGTTFTISIPLRPELIERRAYREA